MFVLCFAILSLGVAIVSLVYSVRTCRRIADPLGWSTDKVKVASTENLIKHCATVWPEGLDEVKRAADGGMTHQEYHYWSSLLEQRMLYQLKGQAGAGIAETEE